jgi:hypothetical protein
MSTLFNRFSHFPKHQTTITPSDAVDISRGPLIIYCTVAGTVAAIDSAGVVVTYTMAVGDVLPLLVKRVNSTGTTATVIGLY